MRHPFRWSECFSFWENIAWNWHEFKGYIKWYDLRYGVENLVRWFPVIWQDRDWDGAYLARIISKKAGQMAHLQEKYGHHEYAERDAAELREVEACFDFVARDGCPSEDGSGCETCAGCDHIWKAVDRAQKRGAELIAERLQYWWD